MTKFIRLSYDISADAPLYPGTPKVKVVQCKSIRGGDSSNTFIVEMSNHAGSHVDGPKHFRENGRSIDKYMPEELIFKKPLIIDCPKSSSEPVKKEDVERSGYKSDADMVLLRTGFSRYRRTSPEKYSGQNPYLSPGAADYLKKRFKKMRALGIDCISIASKNHKEEGRMSHKILLGSPPALIVEDIYIPLSVRGFKEISVAPVFIKGIDSAPCTVTGKIK